MKRLFVCYTPLHALIAKRIMELEKFDDSVVIYICFQESSKHDYYFNQLSKTFKWAYFFPLKHSLFSDVFRLLRLSLKVSLNHGVQWELFTGNIKHFHSRFLMLLLRIKKFNTFDDGSGNVSGAGYFYDQGDRKEVAFLFSLIAPRLLYKNISQNISLHYTIYDFPNVFSPTKKVTLLDTVRQNISNLNGKRVVYFANAFSESGLMIRSEEERMDCEILARWQVNDILMHPRSKKTAHFKGSGSSVIETNLIAEDYVLELMKSGFDVVVIGVKSSALLNLMGVEGLKLIDFSAKLNTPDNMIGQLLSTAGVLMEEQVVPMHFVGHKNE